MAGSCGAFTPLAGVCNDDSNNSVQSRVSFQAAAGTTKVEPTAHANRERLVGLMRRHGFENYPREWWHFSLGGVKDARSYDVPIE